MVKETLGILLMMLLTMGVASWVIPAMCPRVPRTALVQGFIPAIALMISGFVGHDLGANTEAYTSLFALAVFTMVVGPQITVAYAMRKRK